MSVSDSQHVRDLEEALCLLDELLSQPTLQFGPAEMQYDGSCCVGGYADDTFSSDASSLNFRFADDVGIRPKSFLHDEMNEFNQIFSELARPRRPLRPNDSPYSAYEPSLLTGRETPLARVYSVSHSDSQRGASGGAASPSVKTANLDCLLSLCVKCRTGAGHSSTQCPSVVSETGQSDTWMTPLVVREPADEVKTSESSCCTASEDLQRTDVESESEPCDLVCPAALHASTSDDQLNEDDADSGYQSGNNTMTAPTDCKSRNTSTMTNSTTLSSVGERLCPGDLQNRIDCFNANRQGLTMNLESNSSVFEGFIRVHMNLQKPINMALRSRPSSIYDVVKQGVSAISVEPAISGSTEIASFTLPPNTSKVIHITSDMTTVVVIQTLLNKFMITDSCCKFALYEKSSCLPVSPGGQRSNEVLRKLGEDEHPLELCLRWTDDGPEGLDSHQFVLQDNVTSDVMWDAFSVPELEAFLRILDREEDSYVNQIRLKYTARKRGIEHELRKLDGSKACGDIKSL